MDVRPFADKKSLTKLRAVFIVVPTVGNCGELWLNVWNSGEGGKCFWAANTGTDWTKSAAWPFRPGFAKTFDGLC